MDDLLTNPYMHLVKQLPGEVEISYANPMINWHLERYAGKRPPVGVMRNFIPDNWSSGAPCKLVSCRAYKHNIISP